MPDSSGNRNLGPMNCTLPACTTVKTYSMLLPSPTGSDNNEENDGKVVVYWVYLVSIFKYSLIYLVQKIYSFKLVKFSTFFGN